MVCKSGCVKLNEAVRNSAAPTGKAGGKTCLFGVECMTLSWTAGLLSAYLHLVSAAAVITVLLCITLLIFRKRTELLLILTGCVCGISAWKLYDARIRQPLCAMDGQTVVCTGEITEKQIYRSDRIRYRLQTRLNGHSVSVDWYADSGVPELKTGDTVTLSAVLTRIAPDYRFHTEQYQAGQGRYLRIYSAELLRFQEDTGFSLRRAVQNYRDSVTRKIQTAMADEDAALLCAMLFGDKTGMDQAERQSLYRSGIGHITAVSGLHLMFFCTALTWLFRRMHLSKRMQFLLLLPAIALFVLLVDSSVSVYRAACMLLMTRAAALFGRRGDPLRALCITMFACTVFTPYVIGSVSFWLSFSGVFGVSIAAPYFSELAGIPKGSSSLTELAAVSLSVFPASVLLCGESSLIAPLGNLLILPFTVTALYIGFSVLLTGGLTAGLLPAAGLLCRISRVLAESLARLPFSHLNASSPFLRAAVLLLAGILLLLPGFRAKGRHFIAALLFGIVLLGAMTAAEQFRTSENLRVAVLGRKQESVLVISGSGKTAAADLSGAVKNPQYVRTYLAEYGIDRLDVLICSGKNAAAYQKELASVEISEVILRESVMWREDETVCGIEPKSPQDRAFTLRLGELRLICENGVLTAEQGNVSVTTCPAADETVYSANAVIRYGGTAAVSDDAKILLNPGGEADVLPKVCTDRNVLLRIAPDGSTDMLLLEKQRSIAGLFAED